MKPSGMLNSEKHLIQVAVYILIPFLQRWIKLHADLLALIMRYLDRLGFCLGQRLESRDLER